jgi:hypothetical protein
VQQDFKNNTAGSNGLPAGVKAGFFCHRITISGTPTAAGTFNYSIPLTGGCGTVNATGTITVDPICWWNYCRKCNSLYWTNSTTLTLSGNTGTVVRWESSTDAFATCRVLLPILQHL